MDTLQNSIPPVAVWCHACNSSSNGELNQDSHEYECTVCHSSFVEELGQGIEEFNTNNSNSRIETTGASNPPPTVHPETNSIVHDIVMNSILPNYSAVRTEQIGTSAVNTAGANGNAILMPPQVFVSTNQSTGLDAAFSNILAMLENELSEGAVSIRTGPTDLGNGQGWLESFANLPASHRGSSGVLSMGPTQFEDILHNILMNETSTNGTPPATQEMMDALPRIPILSEIDGSKFGECCISQDRFEVGDTMISLSCGHNFKQEPIMHWLSMHKTCPVCRVEIG